MFDAAVAAPVDGMLVAHRAGCWFEDGYVCGETDIGEGWLGGAW